MNYEFLKIGILVMAAVVTAANYPHTYWVIDYTSNVKQKFMLFDKWKINPRAVQNYIFCAVISTAIMFLVFLKLHWWAFGGCTIEVMINCYYVYCAYEEKYLRNKDESAMTRKKRSLVGAYFLAFLFPACIYLFSYLYTIID